MRRLIFVLFSVLTSVGIYSYLLRTVSLTDVMELLHDVDRPATVLFLFLSFAMSGFRVWRYQLILGRSGYQVKSIPLFLVVLVRNCLSDLLPARVGSLAYILIVTTRLGIDIGPATSSFTLAFLFDVLAIVPLLFAAALGISTVGSGSPAVVLLCAATIGGVTIAIVRFAPEMFQYAANCVHRFLLLSASKRERLHYWLSTTAEHLKVMRLAGMYQQVFVLSLIVRALKYAAMYVFLFGLLKPIGYTFSQLHIPKVLLGMISAEAAASMPISGIAGFGAYEGTWATTFHLLGFPHEIATVTAISHHLFTQVYAYSLGCLALLVLLLPVFKQTLKQEPTTVPLLSLGSFYVRLTTYLVCVGISIVIFLFVSLPTTAGAPRETATVSSWEVQPIAGLNERRVVFDSNLHGNFGIYSVGTDGKDWRTIADSPEQDMFPDVSPDGRIVVYARAKSLSRMSPADIWTVSIGGSNPQLLVHNGTFPTFSGDGKTIFFERESRRVMAFRLEDKTETELFPNGNKDFEGYKIRKPRVSAEGSILTFTSDKPQRWNAWYVNLQSKKSELIAHACEPVTAKDEQSFFAINKTDAKAGAGIFRYSIDGKKEALQDNDDPFGHEYFPSLSTDNRYLLFGACPSREHSHEDGNYEIFIRDLHDNRVTRLTDSGHTNRWPKLIPKEER